MSGDMQDSLTALLAWVSRDFNKVHTNIIKRLPRDILGSHRGRGVAVDGVIDPTNSQPGTVRTWMVSTTLRLIYSQERPGAHLTGGRLCLGSCLVGTVKNITGRTFSKQQTKGSSISHAAHLTVGNASSQVQECYSHSLLSYDLCFSPVRKI